MYPGRVPDVSAPAPTGLRVIQPAEVPLAPRRIDRETYRRLAGRVRLLSWVSLAYMTLEGGIAILAGVLAGSVGLAKQRIADQIGSAATKGEGRQNMLCAYLAGALLLGLLGNALAGAWWLDPVVGLLIAGVALREGLEAWRGEGCACSSDPLAGFAEDDCADACCSTPAAGGSR